jgi:hypothetical protein
MSDRAAPKKPFAPIAIDLDEIDNAVEELARRKGIPTLVDPEPIRANPSGAEIAHAKTASVRGGEDTGSLLATHPSLPEIEYATLKFEAPLYLIDELHAAARRQRSSLKYLLLSTLKAQGFEVRDEDLVPDGRRLRGSRAS